MTLPDLTVVTVTHNGRELALRTLASAMEATGPIDVQWIVVDSQSTDGTSDAIAATFPDVELVRGDNRGCAAGNNVGLDRARGRHVLLLNPDVEIQRGTLADLVAAMDARPAVGIASVVQRAPDGSLLPSIRRFPTPLRDLGEALFAARWPILRGWQELELRQSAYAEERSADWLVGAFLIARREAIEAVGQMDDGFFLYSEEVDWCWRFRATGWDVRHLPVLDVVHHAGRRDSGDLMAQLSYSRLRFAAKHLGRRRQAGVRAALAFGHLLRLALLWPPSAVRPVLRPRVRAERAGLLVILGLSQPRYGKEAL